MTEQEIPTTPQEKCAYWQRHIDQWQQSGLSQIEYCRRNRIKKYQWGYWKKRLTTLKSPAMPSSRSDSCTRLKNRPDNNLVENAIRPFVVGRKNFLFSGGPRGAEASCVFYSLIETAKANGLEPFSYLRYIFERLPLIDNPDDYKKLLPQNLDNAIFFKQILTPLLRGPLTPDLRQRLAKMKYLTPGDFKTVRDQYAFYSEEKRKPLLFIRALEEETRIKALSGAKQPIGF